MEYTESIRYLKILKHFTDNDSAGELHKQAYDVAIKACEKQMPKKPILKSRTEVIHLNKGDAPHEWREVKRQDWVCPVCGCFVGQGHNAFQLKSHDQRKSNYCNECGQAINWEEVEDNK